MKGKCSAGRTPPKGENRSVWYWCDNVQLKATSPEDPFILAALYRALFGNEDEANALRKAIAAEAKRCEKDYISRNKKQEKGK